MTQKIKKLVQIGALLVLFCLPIFLITPQTALAANNNQTAGNSDSSKDCSPKSFLGIPPWYKYLPMEKDATDKCSPNLGDASDEVRSSRLLSIGVAILEAILRISSFIALAMIFWGSFKFITAQGNPENVTAARRTVINTAIGFIIVLIAAQVVGFIGGNILG